jgi:peptidoglycan/LPS O-acetylase OafA/YrhL
MLVFVMVITPVMWLWGTPSQVEDARDGVIPSLLYVINWFQIAESADYWALFSDPSPMTHLWSLAVEEQFYIVWPLLVAAVVTRRHWKRWLLAITVTGIVASAVAMAVLYDPADPTRVYIGTDTRASSILLGALLATIGAPAMVQRIADRSPSSVAAAQFLAVGAMAAAWVVIDGGSTALFYGGMVVHALLGALLASSTGLTQATPVQRALTVAPLRWFGSISYGLYLWHWPVFILLDERRTDLDGWALSVLRWSLSIGIALLSYWLIEQPIRRDHRRWTTARLRIAIAGAMVAAVATVFVVPELESAPAIFDPTSITAPSVPATSVASTLPPPASSSSIPEPAGSTSLPEPAGSTTTTSVLPLPRITSLLWQGDSVAYDAAPGVVAAASAAGLTANESTILGLGLVALDGNDPVVSYRDRVAEYRPDAVVLMLSGWDSEFDAAAQQAAFDTYTSMVLDSGAFLIFVTPPPVDERVEAQDIAVMRGYAEELAESQPDRVVFLDASALWGPYQRDINGDGIPDRKADGVHVCPQGAALFGNWLVTVLAERFAGVEPAPPVEWAGGPWTQDARYFQPAGSCS